MTWIVQNLWLIPALPLLAAGLSALAKQKRRGLAASLAIGSMVLAFGLSCVAFTQTLGSHGDEVRQVHNFDWFVLGETALKLGWVLDPITAAMLVMITFVGTLIFIFSVGYMAHDENFTRFFTFLSLFAAAMLGLVIANSLLLLFMCWEVVGLASYLLIGFWYHKPSAAAAAKKAFITTRIGDVFFFLGLLWLSAETGTLLFYDSGAGCLEQSALAKLVGQSTWIGMGVSTAIALLIFCGAIGKSGQVPLHVWLPDAMEGPTPVSALIHAATMVAAGVFLVARMYPLMAAMPEKTAHSATTDGQVVLVRPHPNPLPQEREKPATVTETPKLVELAAAEAAKTKSGKDIETNQIVKVATNVPPLLGGEGRGEGGHSTDQQGAGGTRALPSTALQAVAWIGAITALFAALVAVAQTDIKRILAYSTVSQLGFMFIGLGTGGVAVGMFHLLTHAFFKALLFLGAGSVIHGCHDEQDIRRMGGLRKFMPVTFATYAIGMMALSGVPLVFSGFWSKDEILHAAWLWQPSKWPFLFGLIGAFLTAFYMTRQMWFVFFGPRRSDGVMESWSNDSTRQHSDTPSLHHSAAAPHESPPVMTVPLAILAVCAILLSVFGTPVWPWFHSYLSGHGNPAVSGVVPLGTLLVMFVSAVIALSGIALSWRFYSRRDPGKPEDPDPLEAIQPTAYGWLHGKFYFDELYATSVVRWNAWCGRASRWLDEKIWDNAVAAVSLLVIGVSWLSRLIDEFVVNLGFDQGCGGLRRGARQVSLWQNGQVQRYLRVIGLALAVGALVFIWGCGR